MEEQNPNNSALTSSVEHIESTPGICGGKARIVGTRTRVQDVVVWHERLGQSADEIVSRHPHLSLAAVSAALAYYHDHRAVIDRQMQAGENRVEELRRQCPSKVAAKLDSTG